MSKALSLPLLALAVTACAYGPPPPPTPRESAELAEALRGRVAGPPQACVNQRQLRGNRSVGAGAILFEGSSSNIVYLNYPRGGCPQLAPGRALVTRTTSTSLCQGEIVEVVDFTSGVGFGACGLGDFIPYRRIDR